MPMAKGSTGPRQSGRRGSWRNRPAARGGRGDREGGAHRAQQPGQAEAGDAGDHQRLRVQHVEHRGAGDVPHDGAERMQRVRVEGALHLPVVDGALHGRVGVAGVGDQPQGVRVEDVVPVLVHVAHRPEAAHQHRRRQRPAGDHPRGDRQVGAGSDQRRRPDAVVPVPTVPVPPAGAGRSRAVPPAPARRCRRPRRRRPRRPGVPRQVDVGGGRRHGGDQPKVRAGATNARVDRRSPRQSPSAIPGRAGRRGRCRRRQGQTLRWGPVMGVGRPSRGGLAHRVRPPEVAPTGRIPSRPGYGRPGLRTRPTEPAHRLHHGPGAPGAHRPAPHRYVR